MTEKLIATGSRDLMVNGTHYRRTSRREPGEKRRDGIDEPTRSRRSFEVRRDSVSQSIEFRRHDEVIAMETSNLVSPESNCRSAPFC